MLVFVDAQLKLQYMDHSNTSVECKRLLSHILSATGDCRLMISYVTSTEEWDKFREQTQVSTEIDLEIQQAVDEVGLDETSTGTNLSHLPSCSLMALPCSC